MSLDTDNDSQTTMQKGIVYCLTNPVMPDLVKIGRVETDTVEALKTRMSVLYSTSVPVPFELHYAVVVDDVKQMEGLLHEAFANSRENYRREFFRIDAERVVAAMRLTRGEEISIDDSSESTPDAEISQADIDAQKHARQQENKRLSAFTFTDVNIAPGEVLTFTRDATITAEVLNSARILFEGKESTLSGAANTILERMGKRTGVAGPLFWEYNGETLHRIRLRKEAEKAEESESEE